MAKAAQTTAAGEGKSQGRFNSRPARSDKRESAQPPKPPRRPSRRLQLAPAKAGAKAAIQSSRLQRQPSRTPRQRRRRKAALRQSPRREAGIEPGQANCRRRCSSTCRRPAAKAMAEELPERRAGRDRAAADGSIGDLLVDACKQYAGRPAFMLHGQVDDLAELERLSTAVRRLSAIDRACKEGARVAHHDAERAAISGGDDGASCAPATRWSTSIRSTRRASSSTSSRIPAPRRSSSSKISPHAAGGDRQDRRSSTWSSRRWATCSALKGMLVNFVVRRVKKMVPALVAARPCQIQRGAEGRRRQDLQAGQGRRRRRRLPAIYRRHDRRLQGRGAAAPQRARQCRAERAVGAGRLLGQAEAGQSHLSSARCRSTISSR